MVVVVGLDESLQPAAAAKVSQTVGARYWDVVFGLWARTHTPLRRSLVFFFLLPGAGGSYGVCRPGSMYV